MADLMKRENEPSERTPEQERVQGNQTDVSARKTSEGPESIAQRAYERFQARGGEHGHDQEDWFEAERELNSRGNR